MSSSQAREQAVDLLLGRRAPDLDAFADVPVYLRPRAARKHAVQTLALELAERAGKPRERASLLSPLEAAALVRAATVDADPHVRAAAVAALSRVALPALALPVLLACLADPSALVSESAREALAVQESLGARPDATLARWTASTLPPRPAPAPSDEQDHEVARWERAARDYAVSDVAHELY